jgi:hypothetical protein
MEGEDGSEVSPTRRVRPETAADLDAVRAVHADGLHGASGLVTYQPECSLVTP